MSWWGGLGTFFVFLRFCKLLVTHNCLCLSGHFSALSINTKIDVDDCVCVTPSKKLVLLLNKVAFEELGLEGKVAESAKRTKDRFCKYFSLL